ncbi:MAG: hypothetical protein ABIZ04_21690 [Opitutus sp.]
MASNPNTGVGKLNANLRDAAASLGGPVLQLASGAKATDVAADALKETALSALLGPTALFASGMLAVLGTIKKIVAATGILDRGLKQIAATEQIQGKFETLLKSAVLAKQRIQELYAFTANSPFKFDDVAEANRVLQTLTSGALAGSKGMTLVGDAAAATGQQFSDVASQVGKAYNALSSGRSLDRTLFLMQSTGLVTDGLAKQLEELESVGAGFGEKWGVIETALKASQGGMKNEATSLDALATKLENAGARLEKAFAEPFRDAQAKSLQISIEATDNVTPVFAEIGSDLAPLLTLTSRFKNTLAESTLATKGFADALGVAWQIGKVAFAGIGLATLGKLTTGLGSAGKFVAGTLTGAASAVKTAKAPGGGLASSTELVGKAVGALAPGGEGLVAAASFAAEAVALKATTLAAIVHTQAMAAVGTATGAAAVTSYLGAAAVTVFGGALNLAKRAAIGAALAVRASFAALATNPFAATLIAVGASVAAFLTWRKAIETTDKAYADLSESIAATSKKLTEQAAAASTTDEWTKSVNDLTEAYGKAKDALVEFQNAPENKGGFVEGLKDLFNPSRATKREGSRNQLDSAATNLGRLRDTQIDRINGTGLSDREKDQFKSEIGQREQLREQKFQQDFNLADAETQNRLAAEHIELLKKEAAAGRAAEDARSKFDRSDFGKLAFKHDAKLTDLRGDEERAKKAARALGLTDDQFDDPKAEAARRKALAESTSAPAARTGPFLGQRTDIENANAATNEQTAQKYRDQAKALEDINAVLVKREALEQVISALRRGDTSDELTRNVQEQTDIRKDIRKSPVAAGVKDDRNVRLVALQKRAIEITESVGTFRQKETTAQQGTAELAEAKKVQAMKESEITLDREISAARAKGLETATLEMEKQIKLLQKQRDLATTRPQERRALDAQIAGIRSFQAQFREETALNRDRNERTAKGDFKGAQAVTDFIELRKLTDQYGANGLSPQQAKEDFAGNLRADIRQKQPSVVVDSLQAVGGGGGFSISPGDAIQERLVRIQEVASDTLKRIEKAVGKGSLGID